LLDSWQYQTRGFCDHRTILTDRPQSLSTVLVASSLSPVAISACSRHPNSSFSPARKPCTTSCRSSTLNFFVRLPYPSSNWEGKTVVVTGANVGLGLEAGRHFVRLGAGKVILAVRSLDKGKRAQNSIEDSTARNHGVEVWQ